MLCLLRPPSEKHKQLNLIPVDESPHRRLIHLPFHYQTELSLIDVRRDHDAEDESE
jgi:hypothetical protein